MQLWGRPKHRKSRSGVRGITGTSCKMEGGGFGKLSYGLRGCAIRLTREGTT